MNQNSPFKYTSYKDYLRNQFQSPDSPRGLQSRLATHLECQSAYLYQVLKGSGHLTEDQAYKVTTYFNFSYWEQQYWLLLVRLEKASTPDLRAYLEAEIKKCKIEELNLKNKADSEVAQDEAVVWDYYFSGLLPSAIHLLTSSPKYQTIDAIAKKLGSDTQSVKTHLEQLFSYGFVKMKDKKWHHASPSYHFPKDSKYNQGVQIMRRSQALSKVLSQKSEGDTFFSSCFTLDAESYEKLRHKVADFVKSSQKIVHAGGSDEPYILSIDLFAPY